MALLNSGKAQVGDGNLNEPLYVGRPGQTVVLNGQTELKTIAELATSTTDSLIIVVTDPIRGGTFYWSQSGTADNGITFAGDVGYWVRQYSGEVNIMWFGVDNTGITDSYTAIQAALNTGKTVYFPKGTYLTSNTLIPSPYQMLRGDSLNFNATGLGSIILISPSLNGPGIKFTSPGTIKSLHIKGQSTAATTLQKCIYINNTNSVSILDSYITGAYENIYIDGTSFFTSIRGTTVLDAYNCQLHINSATNAGVDIILSDTRFLGLPSTGTYGLIFNGLGSLLATNVQVSVESGSLGTMLIDQRAPLYGGCQFTNCVFEYDGVATGTSACVHVKGTLTNYWFEMHFVNCLITGHSAIGFKVDYATGIYFTNVTFSSVNTNGSFYISQSGRFLESTLTDCDFEGTGAVPPIQCGTPTTISLNVVSPRWGGSAAFIDFSNAVLGDVVYLDVIGGKLGTATNPVLLNSSASIPGVRVSKHPWQDYTPTVTSASGTFTTVSATGSFMRLGNIVFFNADIVVTDAGTAAGALNITLPSAASKRTSGSGSEFASTGKSLVWRILATSDVCTIHYYDNTFPATTGTSLNVNGFYFG